MASTFVARTYAADIEKTKKIMQQAIRHKGFSYVDIIQPCITFFDTRDYFKENTFWLEDPFPVNDLNIAMAKTNEKIGGKIPLGIFYQVEKPTFEGELWK